MSSRVDFSGRIVVLGCGTVGQCSLALLPRVFSVSPDQIHLADALDRRTELGRLGVAEAQFHHLKVTEDNLDTAMTQLTRPGDLLLNLTIGIDAIDLADWCHHHGVLYVDTALEPWDELVADPFLQPANERTEYFSHQRARNQAAKGWRDDGPTAVVAHGANPGLVSHFAKAALVEVGVRLGLIQTPPSDRDGWARLAQATGTKVIHISERDTQVSDQPRQPDEFVNTWSIAGFVEESMMPLEIGWGSHEKALPPGGARHETGPGNAIYVDRPAAGFLLRSWVPLGGQIAGLALPHSETVTLSDYFTLRDENDRVAYRPTVAFSYLACDGALASLHETMMCDWTMPSRQRILNQDIVDGRDELGILLLGHGLTGWWYGSQLNVAEAREILPGHNTTAIQVAAGVMGAAAWAARNPSQGYCEAEDLPHEAVLAVARPFLGTMASQQCDWTPLQSQRPGKPDALRDDSDPWQFGNFVIGRW